MIRAVCFDLDGTLFDDEQYVRGGLRAAADTLEKRTGQSLHEEFESAYFDEKIREGTFDHVLSRQGISMDHVPALVEAYHANTATLAPYPETEQVLGRLKSGYRLGLLTGGRNGRAKLERLGLTDYFDTIVVAPNRGLTKDNLESFHYLLDSLNVQPDSAVYVGDRPALDIAQANRLGMTTVLVRRGIWSRDPDERIEKPDAIVEQLEEIITVLEEFD